MGNPASGVAATLDTHALTPSRRPIMASLMSKLFVVDLDTLEPLPPSLLPLAVHLALEPSTRLAVDRFHFFFIVDGHELSESP